MKFYMNMGNRLLAPAIPKDKSSFINFQSNLKRKDKTKSLC